MKNAKQQQQDRKFENQVNHLQGFIGMPHWDFSSPSFDEIKEYEKRGKALQANKIHQSFKGLKKLLMKFIGY
ncbi:MAG: hypothetical protein V3U71_00065 [Cocleimonas sp.]